MSVRCGAMPMKLGGNVPSSATSPRVLNVPVGQFQIFKTEFYLLATFVCLLFTFIRVYLRRKLIYVRSVVYKTNENATFLLAYCMKLKCN